MIGRYNIQQAGELIKLARHSINSEFARKEREEEREGKAREGKEKEGKEEKERGGKINLLEKKEFKQARGVFVTLYTFPIHKLRGCIGFPYPSMEIAKAVVEAAKSAAFSDPRFPPLKKGELNNIIIEISILTIPQESTLKEIEIGKHGLICNYLAYSSLLLPQVATEHNLNKLEFIEALCQKAGLPNDAWQKPNFRLYKFQAQIFREKEPNGEIEER